MTIIPIIHTTPKSTPKFTPEELYDAWVITSENPRAQRPWGQLNIYRSQRWTALAELVNERINSQPYEIEKLIDAVLAGIDERLSQKTDPTLRAFSDPQAVLGGPPTNLHPLSDDELAQKAASFVQTAKQAEEKVRNGLELLGDGDLFRGLVRRGWRAFPASQSASDDELLAEARKRGYAVHPLLGSDGPQCSTANESEAKHVVGASGNTNFDYIPPELRTETYRPGGFVGIDGERFVPEEDVLRLESEKEVKVETHDHYVPGESEGSRVVSLAKEVEDLSSAEKAYVKATLDALDRFIQENSGK